MKHKAKSLELQWGAPEAFRLLIETTLDGERVAKEQAQREADRAESEKQQLKWQADQ